MPRIPYYVVEYTKIKDSTRPSPKRPQRYYFSPYLYRSFASLPGEITAMICAHGFPHWAFGATFVYSPESSTQCKAPDICLTPSFLCASSLYSSSSVQFPSSSIPRRTLRNGCERRFHQVPPKGILPVPCPSTTVPWRHARLMNQYTTTNLH